MDTATRKPKTEPETSWWGWIAKTDVTGRSCGADSIHGRTVGDVIADAYRTATYMHSIGYRLVVTGLHRGCRECGGSGSVAAKISKANPAGEKRCKACRGIGIFDSVPEFELEKSPSVTITQV